MMKRLFLLFAAVSLLLCGCANKNKSLDSASPASASSTVSQAASQTQNNFPFKVTDLLKRTVSLDKAPQRIISITPSGTEILCALGLEDKIVGVDAYSDYPSSISKKEKVGDFTSTNIEKIVSLTPDIVIAGTKLQQDTISSLEKLGIKVVSCEATSFSEYYPSVELIGKVCGVSDKAAELTASLKAREDAITEKVKSLSKPSVYFVLSYGQYGDYTCGKGSFVTDLITMAGGACVSADMPVPWPKYSVEKLVAQNPDIVICPIDSVPNLDDFKKAQGYSSLDAVKNNRLKQIDGNLCSRPGPRLIDGLEQLEKLLHE